MPSSPRWKPTAALAAVMLLAGVSSALGTFSSPVNLSATGGHPDGAQIAIGADGAATAVWSRSTGSNTVIQAATRATGSASFASPVNVSVGGGSGYVPQIAISPDGAATAVWQELNSGTYVIKAATRAAGSGSFDTPVALSLGGPSVSYPQIAIGSDGAATVVWARGGTIQATTRAAGSSGFDTPVDVSAAGGTATSPQIAFAPDGSATAVWARSNGSNYIVQAATRAAGSASFDTPVDLSLVGQTAQNPQMALGSDGAATVVWSRRNGGGTKIIQAATRAAGSATFGTPVDLSADGRNALYPQIAIAPDGAATAVWERTNGTNVIIQAATRAAGSASFDTPVDLSAAGGDAGAAQIAIGPDAAVTVVWHRYDNVNSFIQTATRSAGSANFSLAADLTPSGVDEYEPQVAIGPDGGATVVWWRDTAPSSVQAATSAATLARLTVTRAGAGSGSVSSAPPGIDCGLTCSGLFSIGSGVTLTAQPSTGSMFTGWGGACSGTSTTCTVSVTQAASVSATFEASLPTPAVPTETTTQADAAAPTAPTAPTATAGTPGVVRGVISTRLTATGAGTATVTGTSGGRVACATSQAFTAPGSAVTSCLPRAWVQRRRLKGPVKVTVTLAFTPSGAGATQAAIGTVTLPKITLHTKAVTG